MSQTSFKNYAVAGLLGSLIIVIFLNSFISLSNTFDVSEVNNSSLAGFEDFDEQLAQVNSTKTDTYGSSEDVDKSFFDLFGGFFLTAFSTIKDLINGLFFMVGNVGVILGFLGIPTKMVTYVIAVLTLTFTSVLLFKYLAGKDDEK